jgi:hypothetical protein
MDADRAVELGHAIVDGDLDCWTPDHVEAVRMLTAAVEQVRDLAFDRMSHGGGNVEEIWSSEILDIIERNPS